MSEIADRIATHLVEPLGWTLVHSIWQLACLAALLAIGIRVLGRRSADVRYALCGVILCLMVSLTMATYFYHLPSVEMGVDAASMAPRQLSEVIESDVLREPINRTNATSAVSATTDTSQSVSTLLIQRITHAPNLRQLIEPSFPWIVMAWMAGVFLNCFWNLGGWIAVQRMARLGTRPVTQVVEETLAELAARLQSTRCVKVVESVMVQAPCVIGWLRPVILLPLGIISGLSPKQLEAVLAHELAHIRRHDFLANLLQTVVETLLFYHPAVWYVSRRMRLEREYCADQLAAAITGDSIMYARALAAATEHVESSPQFALAASGGSLMNRVRRLFGLETRDGGRTGSWLLGATGSLVMLFSLVVVPPIHSALFPSSAPRVTVRRVWAAESGDAHRVSPDGRYIAYVDWDDGNLGVHDRETGTSRLLTKQGTWDSPNRWAEAPIWSPDSKRIAFVWIFDEQPWQLRVLPLNDAEPRTLYTAADGGNVYTADWSPDGSHILVSIRDAARHRSMNLVNVSNGSVVHLRDLRTSSQPGDISPDGRFVAFMQQSPEDAGKDVFLYEMSTGKTTPLIQHPADDHSPLWSPDGKWLTFLSTRTGYPATWMVRVTDGKTQDSPRQMSPELQHVAVLGFSQRGAYYFWRKAPYEIFGVSYDSRRGRIEDEPRLLVRRFEGRNRGPVWSPAGKKLAFFSVRPTPQGSRRTMLVVRDEATGRESISDADLEGYLHLQWLPDGDSVLIRAMTRSGQPGIFRWNIERGITAPVVTWERSTSGSIGWSFAVSPDGESLFYSRTRDGTAHVVNRQLASGKEREIAAYPSTNTPHLAISPNGKLLALKSSFIKTIDLETGQPRQLYEENQRTQGITWTTDSQHLLFWGRADTSRASLWRISAQGGEPELVGLAGWGQKMANPLNELEMRPDGKQIAFTARRNTYGSEVWAIENSLLVQDK